MAGYLVARGLILWVKRAAFRFSVHSPEPAARSTRRPVARAHKGQAPRVRSPDRSCASVSLRRSRAAPNASTLGPNHPLAESTPTLAGNPGDRGAEIESW